MGIRVLSRKGGLGSGGRFSGSPSLWEFGGVIWTRRIEMALAVFVAFTDNTGCMGD